MKAFIPRGVCLFFGTSLILYAFAVLFSVRFGAGQIACAILGTPLVIWGLFYNKINAWAKKGKGVILIRLIKICYAAAAVVIALFCGLMFFFAAKAPAQGADALIVLGAGLNGEDVSIALQRRLDAAYDYMIENPETICVVSGGQGPDESVPEAVAMRAYLERRGLDSSRIIAEDQSVNTAQNIEFSKEKLKALGEHLKIVIVTSDFHVLRGTLLARGAGFVDAEGLSADSEPYLLPQYCLREIIGLVKDGVLGRY